MSTVEDTRSIKFWDRVALTRLWLLARSRPQLHYAVEVLFQTVVYGTTITLTVFVLNLFNLGLAVDFNLIGHFVGPLCLGALAAGFVRGLIPDESALRGWIVSGTFGGVAVMAFAILVELRWRTPTLEAAALGFVIGVASFMFLHWLYELEARKNHAP
jgi:hypothetical protein